MEHQTVGVENAELTNSPIDNSVTNSGTTNNYEKMPSNTPSDYAQLRVQLDRMEQQQNRIEQQLNFLLQELVKRD